MFYHHHEMRKLRILGIDDDPLQAELLRSHIEALGHYLIEVCTEISQFKRLFLATEPELLIVDIDLKAEESGVDLVRNLENQPPTIYLTGVKDQHTIQEAINSDAIAYISKPYTQTDLFAGISLAERNLDQDLITTDHQNPVGDRSCLYIKQSHYLVKVNFTEIRWIEVQEKHCDIHTRTEKYSINARLKDLLSNLNHDFIQIHRSFVINHSVIDKIDLKAMKAILSDRELPIGRHYKPAILSKLNML